MIKLNEKFLSPFVRANEVAQMEAELEAARKTVMDKSGAGSDFLGWLDLPVDYDKEEFARIKAAAAKIQKRLRRSRCHRYRRFLSRCARRNRIRKVSGVQ